MCGNSLDDYHDQITELGLQIVLIAHLYPAPGKAEKLQRILSDIQKHANSDAEPGCVEYRPARSFVTEGGKDPALSVASLHLLIISIIVKFIVWEVYKNREALQAHSESKPFRELKAGMDAGDLVASNSTVECM